MSTVEVEKIIDPDGTVWRRTTIGEYVVDERAEALLTFAGVADSYAVGSTASIGVSLTDFDGAARHDAGSLHLRVDGADVGLELTDGAATLSVESDAAGDITVSAVNDFSIGLRSTPIVLRFV